MSRQMANHNSGNGTGEDVNVKHLDVASNNKYPDKKLTIRAGATTQTGKTIAYLREIGFAEAQAAFTIDCRFLPYLLDLSNREDAAKAIACAEECFAWGRAIYKLLSINGFVATSEPTEEVNKVPFTPEEIEVRRPNNKDPLYDTELAQPKGVSKAQVLGLLDN